MLADSISNYLAFDGWDTEFIQRLINERENQYSKAYHQGRAMCELELRRSILRNAIEGRNDSQRWFANVIFGLTETQAQKAAEVKIVNAYIPNYADLTQEAMFSPEALDDEYKDRVHTLDMDLKE